MKKQDIKKYAEALSFRVKVDRFPELAKYCEQHGLVLLCEIVNMPEIQEAYLQKFLTDSDVIAEKDPLESEIEEIR